MSITISSESLPDLDLSATLGVSTCVDITLPPSKVGVTFTFRRGGIHELTDVHIDGMHFVSNDALIGDPGGVPKLNHTPSINKVRAFSLLQEEARAAKRRQIEAVETQLRGLHAELEAI